jgi:hypothetical protein
MTELDCEIMILSCLRIPRLELLSQCAALLCQHLGPVWIDPFLMEDYILYRLCRYKMTRGVSQYLIQSCMDVKLLTHFYTVTDTLTVNEYTLGFVAMKNKVSEAHVKRSLINICGKLLVDNIDWEQFRDRLMRKYPSATLVGMHGTEGMTLQQLKRVAFLEAGKQDIFSDQIIINVHIPIRIHNKIVTPNVLRLTLVGDESEWASFVPKTRYNKTLVCLSLEEFALHVLIPFRTGILDQQHAHASVVYMLMSYLYEYTGALSDLQTWDVWKGFHKEPLQKFSEQLVTFHRKLLQISPLEARRFKDRVNFLKHRFLVGIVVGNFSKSSAVTYVTPGVIQ